MRLHGCPFRTRIVHSRPPCFRRQLNAHLSTSVTRSERGRTDKWNYNKSPLVAHDTSDYNSYPIVTANDLEDGDKPPSGVKMLVRDFIEDSLYNPNYGYFPKQATIFDTVDSPFDFHSLKDAVEFQEEVAKKYAGYGQDKHTGPGKQLWHTPTELFKPWYGRAIAQCLVSEYLLKYFPYEDFTIYEIGAGNGTLALDILNYLKEEYPDVYERTRYNIIEISANLANLQKRKLRPLHPCVRVSNKSIFHWTTREPAPCFFLAMEVIDNFAHDLIRYDLRTFQPKQGYVVIDKSGDFDMEYAPVTDHLVASFLDMRRQLGQSPAAAKVLQRSPLLRSIYSNLPLAANLSSPEYIPTRLLSLLRTLRSHFPRHRLLLSDFSTLPNQVPGYNAPVVQTRLRNVTVPCSTLLVQPGYFDIFFPTNFEALRDMYEWILAQPSPTSSSQSPFPEYHNPLTLSSSSMTLGADFFSSRDRRLPVDGVASASGLPVGERKSSVFTHAEFLETYGELESTSLQNGENPMVDFYKNVKFLF